ncbi:hypothetical protein BJX96DRAFT_158365 [Aspergillus floccosus]
MILFLFPFLCLPSSDQCHALLQRTLRLDLSPHVLQTLSHVCNTKEHRGKEVRIVSFRLGRRTTLPRQIHGAAAHSGNQPM